MLSAWARFGSDEPTQPFVGLPAPATTLSDLHLALLDARDPDAAYRDMEIALGWGGDLVYELLLRALRSAGPVRAAELASEIDLAGWPPLDPSRLDADEAAPAQRRKLLSRPVRDMERSVGKNARAPGAPSLRELTALAGLRDPGQIS